MEGKCIVVARGWIVVASLQTWPQMTSAFCVCMHSCHQELELMCPALESELGLFLLWPVEYGGMTFWEFWARALTNPGSFCVQPFGTQLPCKDKMLKRGWKWKPFSRGKLLDLTNDWMWRIRGNRAFGLKTRFPGCTDFVMPTPKRKEKETDVWRRRPGCMDRWGGQHQACEVC